MHHTSSHPCSCHCCMYAQFCSPSMTVCSTLPFSMVCLYQVATDPTAALFSHRLPQPFWFACHYIFDSAPTASPLAIVAALYSILLLLVSSSAIFLLFFIRLKSWTLHVYFIKISMPYEKIIFLCSGW